MAEQTNWPAWCKGQPPPDEGPGSRVFDALATCADILQQRNQSEQAAPTGCYWLLNETGLHTLARCEMEFLGGGWEVVPMAFDPQGPTPEGITALGVEGCGNELMCTQSYQLDAAPLIDMRAQLVPVARSFARDSRLVGPFDQLYGVRLVCGGGQIQLNPMAYDGNHAQIYSMNAGTATFINMNWWWPNELEAGPEMMVASQILDLEFAGGINTDRFLTMEFLNLFLSFQPQGEHLNAHRNLNGQDQKCEFGLPMGEVWLRDSP
jgi:hypothetical protein